MTDWIDAVIERDKRHPVMKQRLGIDDVDAMRYYPETPDDEGIAAFCQACTCGKLAYISTTGGGWQATEELAAVAAWSMSIESRRRLVARGGDPKNAPCVLGNGEWGRTSDGKFIPEVDV